MTTEEVKAIGGTVLDPTDLVYTAPDTDDLSPDDAETLAQRLNDQKRQSDDDLYALADIDLDGAEYPIGDGFNIKPPDPNGIQSEARESVTLPVIVRVFYDFMKVHDDWHSQSGRDTFQEWTEEVILDHILFCCDKIVTIGRRSEVLSGQHI